MSGSYDNTPDGRPRRAPSPNLQSAYDDTVTGPTSRRIVTTGGPVPDKHGRLYASRSSHQQIEPGHKQEPVVPAGSVTGKSLTLVISIMCFLACLTAGAVYMMHQSADAWLRDVASEVTVQVAPKESSQQSDENIKEIIAYLQAAPGVSSVHALSEKESSELLEPWLGSAEGLKNLPVPRLIAIVLDRNAPPNLDSLSKELKSKFPGAVLDDHRHWQQQIRTVTRSFALGGVGILLLVAAATTAIIVSATRSSMASNREIVEVLHFVGATDGFISREFEKHFLRLGIKAGIVGALLAMLVFLLMPTAMLMLGGGQVSLTELNRFIGSGSLDAAGYILLGIVVIVIAALCMLTSRVGVYRILNDKW